MPEQIPIRIIGREDTTPRRGRRADDPPVIGDGLGKELLEQVLARPPAADILEAHQLAVLQAQAEAERAKAELFGTLHVLALEVRQWIARSPGVGTTAGPVSGDRRKPQ